VRCHALGVAPNQQPLLLFAVGDGERLDGRFERGLFVRRCDGAEVFAPGTQPDHFPLVIKPRRRTMGFAALNSSYVLAPQPTLRLLMATSAGESSLGLAGALWIHERLNRAARIAQMGSVSRHAVSLSGSSDAAVSMRPMRLMAS
jgi:hypothetical protein